MGRNHMKILNNWVMDHVLVHFDMIWWVIFYNPTPEIVEIKLYVIISGYLRI